VTSTAAILGTIVKTVGLKGEVKLLPGPDFWTAALDSTGLELTRDGEFQGEARVDKYRIKGNTYILKLSGVGTIDEAEKLVGCALEAQLGRIEESSLPREALPCQMMGLDVVLPDGTTLGSVIDMLLGSNQDCFIVEGKGGKHLIPNVPEVVRSIDLEKGIIEIDPPEGLLDLRY